MQSHAPLSGIKILDFSTMISGPMATMILADQGADVIKIETPQGDYVRSLTSKEQPLSAMYINNNRNKRSLALDLKTAAGQTILKQLLSQADVVVENFRPGVAKRLGLDVHHLRQHYSQLIYLSITGFGETGELSHKPTYDPIIQAFAGLAEVQGGGKSQRPQLIRSILVDKLTALTASQAICSALIAKARTGQGDHISVSMLDAALQFLWASDMNAHTFVDHNVQETNNKASFIDLIYQTTDGYITLSIMTDKQWQSLCYLMERPELINDSRFNTAYQRERYVNDRLKITQDYLIQHTSKALLKRLNAHDIPCAPVLTREEVYRHPQVTQRHAVIELIHNTLGRIRQAAPAARFQHFAKTEHQLAPKLGEHKETILMEAGFDAHQIANLGQQGAFGYSRGEK